jgi:hypothetical protein
MSLSSASSRAQSSPVAGLIAAVAVVAAVGGYLQTFEAGDDGSQNRHEEQIAATTLSRVHGQVTSGGVAVPARLANAASVGPDGYHLRVTLSTGDRTWHVGPEPPTTSGVASADRRVGVAVRAGRVRPGDLAVEVWP